MKRVLRPGGRPVLVDHVHSTVRPIYWLQKATEVVSVRTDGDRMTRRRADGVEAAVFVIVERERLKWGPSSASSPSRPTLDGPGGGRETMAAVPAGR
jgi:hypothetical protein